jgi:hypothetical protein
MHRSGTSLVTRILNLLGVYLGPEHALVPAGPDNPKGFWEHRSFVQLNDAILARFGGNAIHPPFLPTGWHDLPYLRDLRQHASAFLQDDFGSAPFWGWKDPRTCLTLPFWQSLLPSMRYVLCVRHPLAVARSLEHRQRLPQLHAVHLWLTHVQLSTLHTAEQPRLVVSCERFFAECDDEIDRIAQFLGQPPLRDRAEVRRTVHAFLDASLHHHRNSPGVAQPMASPTSEARLLELAEQVYLALTRSPGASIGAATPLLDQALDVAKPLLAEAQAKEAERWRELVAALGEAVAATAPAGAPFILVDDNQIGQDFAGRPAFPFLEREGVYWGPPADDVIAVRELERLRRAGAACIAVTWPAFWWLEHYAGFARHLRERYRCVLENDQLVVFDLRQAP